MDDNTSILMSFEFTKPSPLVITLTFVASISGFMFGYDTGYISSALVAIGTDLDNKALTYSQKELITAATSLGALIGALFAGAIADLFGRKPVILFSNVMFIAGAVIQCAAHTVWTMIGGRFVMGIGVGFGSLIAPLYISELAPSRFRGRLVIINVLAITGGQLVAYGIGAGLTDVYNGWRILVGVSLVPTAIQFCLVIFLSDTPRYYVMKGNYKKARDVISKTHKGATSQSIEAKIKEFDRLNDTIPGGNIWIKSWNAIREIHLVPSNFRALILACGLQGIQQFTGWNSLMYFSGTIFETVGFKNSTAVSIIISGTNFLFTLIAFFVIDRVGRRKILLIGLPMMMLSLTLCAIAFHFMNITFEDHDALLNEDTEITGWAIVIIISMIWFAASYAIGIGNVPWQQSELFSQSVRGVGTAFSTTVNWAGSLTISSTFLTMLDRITPTGTFAFFAGVSLFSLVFVYFLYPELSGLQLGECQDILTNGFNIKRSKELSKRRKQEMKNKDHFIQKKEKERSLPDMISRKLDKIELN
ncbi:sugar porter family MFS transporter [Ascoidea rubescens DSM 1968]|uniref:General substrate transporter n=1 Tax=Ascoidea rubescens DSM 1968 TaxID=1344418 RepID=A0A1D2VG04_9ASCO|nr:general substrate transporter [Ascoidea rubescens DSM 1968]ODV60608.1 general substrate transporter [Ascoidea rubescens DSM 1968]